MGFEFWFFGQNYYISDTDLITIGLSVGIPITVWFILKALANWLWKPKLEIQLNRFSELLMRGKKYQSEIQVFLASYPKQAPYTELVKKVEADFVIFGQRIQELDSFTFSLGEKIDSTTKGWGAAFWPVVWLVLLVQANKAYKSLGQSLASTGNKLNSLTAQTETIAEQVHKQILNIRSNCDKTTTLCEKLQHRGLIGASLSDLVMMNFQVLAKAGAYFKELPEKPSNAIVPYKELPATAIVIGHQFNINNKDTSQELLKKSTNWMNLVVSIENQIKEANPPLFDCINYYKQAIKLTSINWSTIGDLVQQYYREFQIYKNFPNQVDVKNLECLNGHIGNLIVNLKRFIPDIRVIQHNYDAFKSLIIQIPPRVESLNIVLSNMEKEKSLSLDWHAEKMYLSHALLQHKVFEQKQIQTPEELNSDLGSIKNIDLQIEQILGNYKQAKSDREYILSISEQVRNNNYPLPEQSLITELHQDTSLYDLANWAKSEQDFIVGMFYRLKSLVEKRMYILDFSVIQTLKFDKLAAVALVHREFTKEHGSLVNSLKLVRSTLDEIRKQEAKCRELIAQHQSDVDYAIRLTRNSTFQQITGSKLADFLNEFDILRREVFNPRYGVVSGKLQRLEKWASSFGDTLNENHADVKSAIERQDNELQKILNNIQSLVNVTADNEIGNVRYHLNGQYPMISVKERTYSSLIASMEQLSGHWQETAQLISRLKQMESDVSRAVTRMENGKQYAHKSKDQLTDLLNKKWPPYRQDVNSLDLLLKKTDDRLKSLQLNPGTWSEKLHSIDEISEEYNHLTMDYKQAKSNLERDRNDIQHKENKIKRIKDAWNKFKRDSSLNSDTKNQIDKTLDRIDKELNAIRSRFSNKNCSETDYNSASCELEELITSLTRPIVVNNVQYMALWGNIEAGGDVRIEQKQIVR